MKLFTFFTICFYLSTGFSKIRIMSFNTMCDFCNGSKLSEFDTRMKALNSVIKSHGPDLIGLQEVRTKSQLNTILTGLENYKFIAKNFYADPAIVYNFKKFKLLNYKFYWLGDDPNSINFGWKLSLPRALIKAEFLEISSGKKITFMSSHFDNRLENLEGASKFLAKISKQIQGPIIFAGDTNLNVEMDSYKNLVSTNLNNSFDLSLNFSFDKTKHKNLCYRKKGKIFPNCRVDHILIAPKSSFKVLNFNIDTKKNFKNTFPSDHRAVIVDLELL